MKKNKKKLYQLPPTVTISIRMPIWLLEEIRSRAIYADVPYQSYIKMTLADFILKKNKKRD